jgi:regulator of protease activity HflC (stomatin/prohibitin superfamily)
MDPIVAAVLVVVLVLLLIVAYGSIRIAREYERGVVFRLGRLIDLKGPGIFFILPLGIDRLTKVDLRIVAQDVPTQEVVTLDNVTVKVNAVVFYQVVDARAAITRVSQFASATMLMSQTTLRSVLGQSSLDELLAGRDKISVSLQQIIDQHTEPWGIKVRNVEVKYVELPSGMQRALARQAEAEREKRAKIIAAEGEFQAAQTLTNAAQVMSSQPAALALRYMQTLLDLGVDKNTTVVFPIPLELIRPLIGQGQPATAAAVADGERAAAERS